MLVMGILCFRIVFFKIIWLLGKWDKFILFMELVEWNLIIVFFLVNERIEFLMEGILEMLFFFILKVKDLLFFEICLWFLLLLKEG